MIVVVDIGIKNSKTNQVDALADDEAKSAEEVDYDSDWTTVTGDESEPEFLIFNTSETNLRAKKN